ncbi:uncharacterized protein EV422DRAFT_503645 [Fimicolochytrium jonesii]|uniref:uncharacterized protein n=1 Tax=Fimicolochytrium jonesii TaxID=1396493 RepID=UPI0022FE5562|nr:uncharacterized protein EV422DRAFT_503645 [Fimicolochytrium jonesii]KAI8824846.1 hypothetical protein EV422DRAFT_503645 [Fimicolochytrium jonesii]
MSRNTYYQARGAGQPLGGHRPAEPSEPHTDKRSLTCLVAALVGFACVQANTFRKSPEKLPITLAIDPTLLAFPTPTELLYGLRALGYRLCQHLPLRGIQVCEVLPYRSPWAVVTDEAAVKHVWTGLFWLALVGGIAAGPVWMVVRHRRVVGEYAFPVLQGIAFGALLFSSSIEGNNLTCCGTAQLLVAKNALSNVMD